MIRSMLLSGGLAIGLMAVAILLVVAAMALDRLRIAGVGVAFAAIALALFQYAVMHRVETAAPDAENGATAAAPEVYVFPHAVDRVAELVAKYEGRASGGLRYVGQRGAWPGPNGYAEWATRAEAEFALRADLQRKYGRGMTLDQVMDVWCEGGCRYRRHLLREALAAGVVWP